MIRTSFLELSGRRRYSLKHGPALMRSLVPFFGDGAYFASDDAPPDAPPAGDATVKAELRDRAAALEAAA